MDVASKHGDTFSLAICEPASVTKETEEKLTMLKTAKNADILILHSQYGKPGSVQEKFKAELEAKRFRLMAIVPPPFDDVYEYDIWMFEETFRDVLGSVV